MNSSVEEEIIKYYDATAPEYDDIFKHPFMRLCDTVTWKYIREHLPESKDALILDAGGGTGHWAIPIAKLGYRVILVDISEGMLKQAQKNIQENKLGDKILVKKGDIVKLEFPEESFDMILCEGDVLSLCKKPVDAIRKMHRVLKIGGTIVAGVFNRYNQCLAYVPEDLQKAQCYLTREKYYIHETPFGNVAYYTFFPEELKSLFESNGYIVQKIFGECVTHLAIPKEKWKNADKMSADWLEKLIRIEFKLCEDPYCFGLGAGLHVIAQKRP